MRILAFEPFDAGSHRAVRESISRHSRHRWRWFTRPGRAWKWRMRLAALELIDQARAAGALDEPVDLIFTTSLLSVTDLRAYLPCSMRVTPIVLYMHENQAAYPVSDRGVETARPDWDAHFALTNLTSVLAADRVLWNSQWNLQSFINGISDTLHHAPDAECKHWINTIRARSAVAWPPIEIPIGVLHNPEPSEIKEDTSKHHARGPASTAPVRILWPHRWEHDKGPDELLDIARTHTRSLNIRWTILGEQFREKPPALQQFLTEFADAIDHAGYVESRAEYWRQLARCDWVLSTARHEFFGIAVVEALLAGCLPWLPDRLSYPELLPLGARNISPALPPDDPASIYETIINHLRPALASHSVAHIDSMLESTSTSRA